MASANRRKGTTLITMPGKGSTNNRLIIGSGHRENGFFKTSVAVFLVISLLVLLLLAVTKPSESDFHSWARANIRAEANAGLLERGMIMTMRTQMRLEATYRDYAVVAIVDTRVGGNQLRYLGIAGQWILLEEDRY